MAETQVESTTTPPAQVQDWRKVKKVPKPDGTAFRAGLEKREETMGKLQEQINGIKEQLGGGSKRREEFMAQVEVHKNRVAELRKEVEVKLAEKKAIQDQIDGRDKKLQSAAKEVNELKKSLKYFREEDIEKAIRDIEFRLSTETLDIKDEKRLVAEVNQLRASKGAIKEYETKAEDLKNERDRGKDLFESSRQKTQEINELRDSQREEKKKIDELFQNEREKIGNKDQLVQERQDLYNRIKALRAEKDQLRADFKKSMDEYYQNQREVRALQREEQRRRREQEQLEWESKQEERDNELVEKKKENPHLGDIFEIDQLITYLTGLTPSANNDSGDKNGTGVDIESLSKDVKGKVHLADKKNLESDLPGFFGGEGKKKNKKGRRQNNKSAKGIQHSADVFASCAKFKVDVPMNLEGVTDVLATLEAKKKECVDWKAPSEEELEAFRQELKKKREEEQKARDEKRQKRFEAEKAAREGKTEKAEATEAAEEEQKEEAAEESTEAATEEPAEE